MPKPLRLIHPFLLSVTLILFVYSRGKGQIPAGDLIRPLIVATTLVLAISAGAIWFTGSYVKGTLLASASLISLVATEAAVNQAASASGGHLVGFIATLSFLASLAGFLIGFAILLRKTSRDMTAPADLISVTAFALFAFNISSVVLSWPSASHTVPPQPTLGIGSLPGYRPDIFFLVLDGYARHDVLRKVYAHDNSSFLDFLEKWILFGERQ